MSTPGYKNPFKNFAETYKDAPQTDVITMQAFGSEDDVISPLETSLEPQDLMFMQSEQVQPAVANPQDDPQNWVQYLDDETGCLYWYNQDTGEARWLTEEEQNKIYQDEQQQEAEWQAQQGNEGTGEYDQQQYDYNQGDFYYNSNPAAESENIENDEMVYVEVVGGPWEKYYDDNGNPFYYNRVSISLSQ
jgi:hypothetical protein